MKIEEILSITGKPGLFKLVATRPNGLVVKNLDGGPPSFVSSRKHQFSPLESIGIYKNDGDTADLKSIFTRMLENAADIPEDYKKMPNADLMDYFKTVLPEYDADMVKPRDVKKLLSWYAILQSKDLLAIEKEAPVVEDKEDKEKETDSPEATE